MAGTLSSIGDSVLSLEQIAAVKVAILVCCGLEIKKQILYTPYGVVYETKNIKKLTWSEIIEEKASMALRKFRLPETLQEKVISAVLLIGMKMIIWAEYLEGIIEITRECSFNFLNASYFTPQGLIDNKKAAKEIMDVECLDIHQKFKIACVYCFIDDIFRLFRQMPECDMEEHTCIRESGLVTYWSDYLENEVDNIKGDETQDEDFLVKAVQNGSKAAVEFCLEQRILMGKELDLVNVALEAGRNRVKGRRDDWFIFQKPYQSDSWVPNDYYVDIILLLLSKMTENEQMKFLYEDIKGTNYKRIPFLHHTRSRVLEYFLKWPYQDNFMKTANLMWDFLPERNYVFLLLEICDMVGPRVRKHVNYGEEKIYDYMGLLTKFWCQSPERLKRYFFSAQEEGGELTVVVLLKKLFRLESFTPKEAKLIELLFASAKDEEKENVFTSIGWESICIKLMARKRWSVLDMLTVNCFSSKERMEKFKRDFIFTEKAQHLCIDFAVGDKWNSFESALKWSNLHDEEINQLGKALINSPFGRERCENLIVYADKYETFDKFVMWCLPSAEEVKAFKKEIVYTDRIMKKCADLAANEATGDVDKLTKFFLSSKEEIKEFRKDVAYRVGGDICGRLISQNSYTKLCDKQLTKKLGHAYYIRRGNWEVVEKFLTWCFSSEKEINEFKRKKIKVLRYIHHDLIQACQFEEAETYFAWLELSAEEIRDLKKDDFFSTYMVDNTFRRLFYVSDKCLTLSTPLGLFNSRAVDLFSGLGSYEDAVELLLRWYLTDTETVLEFSREFKLTFLEDKYEDKAKVKDAFKKFDLAIAQLLSDLEEENVGRKRKSENSSSRKRLCI